MNIIETKSPHHSSREGRTPIAIVIHVMEGTLAGTNSWFQNPISKVSTHYGIGRAGQVHRYVDEARAAWHAGRIFNPTWPGLLAHNISPNLYTIGIEHEGTATSTWPDAMYNASAQLVADICKRWAIPLDRAHIIGHREIYAKKTCPGKGDVDKIIALARALMPRLLLFGSKGDDVRALQRALGLAETGEFDHATDTAVRLVQCRNNLEEDGKVGKDTRAALGL